MPPLLQTLYSTVHYYFSQYHDLNAYIQNRIKLASYDHDGLTIKVAEATDFQQIANTFDKYHDSSRITVRTNRGDVCVVAYKHGAIAHVRWAAVTSIPFEGSVILNLDPDEAYTYDSYTVPAFRRQGIGSETKMFLLTYLKQQGIRYAYSDSRLDNVNTQQVWKKRVHEGRARILGVITVTTRLGRTRCTFVAETEETRPLLARLFHIPMQDIRIQSIYQFLHEEQPDSYRPIE
jgi:GNAT superfamily N-acetyltransferase